MVTKIDWLYLAIVSAFTLGIFIGMTLGKKKALAEMLAQQQRMEATKVWSEAISRYMGGQK